VALDEVVTSVRVLCLNSGSSSLKFALYDGAGGDAPIATGVVERIGMPGGRLVVRDADGRATAETAGAFGGPGAAVHAVLDAVAAAGHAAPDAVGHRLVHGGPDRTAPVRIDASVLEGLRQLVPFAPLHLPAQLEGVEAVAARFPATPQVACFDTAFHRRMPEVAQRLPLPRRLWDDGVRRYGFHGLSYEYVVQAVGAARLGRAIIAHLGNGASMAAVRDGVSVDTTMGFTPTGGFMMGTRSGDLDPSIVVHLLARHGHDGGSIERLVDRDSGLLGVSGTTADMETLLRTRADDPHAAQAVAMFCYALRKQVGSFAAVLDGLDTLVFTGGIGEHAAPVRWESCRELAHLGIRLDASRNDAPAPVISADAAGCTVRVVPTDENLVVARHTRALLAR
jgi:acetate kinase